MLKFPIFLFLVLQSSIIFSQQISQSLRILDSKDKSPIPYAHISYNNKLLTVSDYSGYFSLILNNDYDYIKISNVGYDNKKVQKSDIKFSDKTIIIYLTPSSQKLNEVVITPNSLKDMIAEVYSEIPNKYYPHSHKLIGDYSESYKDTSNVTQIYLTAEIEAMKTDYNEKISSGDVKVTKTSFEVRDSSIIKLRVYGATHYVHYGDVIMKRSEFINPKSFDKYSYEIIGQESFEGRVLDIIAFTPSKSSAHYKGVMFVDFENKVFVKFKFESTKSGVLSQIASKWDHKTYIINYSLKEGYWTLSHLWGESSIDAKDFKFILEFRTKKLIKKPIDKWSYDEKFSSKKFLIYEAMDSVNLNMAQREQILSQVTKTSKVVSFIFNLENSISLKTIQIKNHNFRVNNTFNHNSLPTTISSNFEVYAFEPTLTFDNSYNIGKNWLIECNYGANFRKDWKIKHKEIGISKRLAFKTPRPIFLKVGLAYQGIKNTFSFSKIDGFTPKYEKKYSGLNGSIKFEIELNPRKRFYIGYNYAYQLNDKDEFYLERKHGFLNLKKEEKIYTLSDINLEVDGISASTFPNVFIDSALNLGLLGSIGW